MKQFRYILLAALLLVAASCDKPVKPEAATLTVSPSTLEFKADDASNKLVLVTTTEPWTVSTSATWIHLDKKSGDSSGSVTVTVDVNEATDDRKGTISFSGAQKADVTVTQAGSDIVTLVAQPAAFDGNKRSSTTYQLLIYSFADSDGDGVGDFKGIISKLDYLDAIGATALWLSPAHPTSSYHAYDVNDYSTVNPLYGTEKDFKDLVDAAHAKGIKIYMDYVLNHSGSNNAWFKEAVADPSSPYRAYYVFSDNTEADVAAGKIDNYGGAKNPGMGDWHSVSSGNRGYKGRLHFKLDWSGAKKTVTVTKSDADPQTSNKNAKIWLWIGSVGAVGLYEKDKDIYEITIDVDTDWGFLVRTSDTTWDNGTKWGGNGNTITFGEPYTLNNSSPTDITFGGSTSYYFASFSTNMPDLNYGKYDKASESPAFQAIAATADRWITDFGVDGFRLDAVLWIYQGQITPNQQFLKQWYDHCNATFHAAGHTDDIFMVGEAWEGHSTEKNYYKGINSCFEFEYFGSLTRALGGSASGYVSDVNKYISEHTAMRPDAITSIFMTNHDQNRAAESLGKNLEKEKQAAAMMLTTPGKPFIYQGEELGYWGNKDERGDEYVRTPIMWDKAGKDCAKKGVNNGKVDNAMLTASISVEAQAADKGSLLSVYRDFSRIRNTYPALASGTMTASSLNSGSVASWYMTSTDGKKMLVIHNCASSEKQVAVSDDISKPVAVLGTVKADRKTLIMPAHSSVVFDLQ